MYARVTRLTTLALVAGAIAAPAASAYPADMHASTAIAAAEARQKQDLRSADARDGALRAEREARGQDLRSPDTVDAAAGRGTSNAPDVVVVKVKYPQPVAADGLDWRDAGIGAATIFGLALVTLGGTLVAVQRRQSRVVAH